VSANQPLYVIQIDLLDPDSSQGIDEKDGRELATAELVGNRGFGFLTP
jgi:hypothetical protein